MTISVDQRKLLAALDWKQLSAEQKLACLKSIAHPDSTAKQIAHMAYREFGFQLNRNQVIGVANRAGLSLPGFTPNLGPKPKAKPRITPERKTGIIWHRSNASQPLPKVDATAVGKPVSFLDLNNTHCRWPVSGKPGPEMMCCGAPAMILEKGTRHSYCEYHRKLSKGSGTPSERRATRRPLRRNTISRAGVMEA